MSGLGHSYISGCFLQAIRVFVETVLRYGLPVNFVCTMMKPGRGADARLHELLHV